MADRISDADFNNSEGITGWHAESDVAVAQFDTGSFDRGVQLVVAIGRLADAANHHPDVDLRYPEVDVRLTTHDANGLSAKDVDLARQITQAAADLGIAAK